MNCAAQGQAGMNASTIFSTFDRGRHSFVWLPLAGPPPLDAWQSSGPGRSDVNSGLKAETEKASQKPAPSTVNLVSAVPIEQMAELHALAYGEALLRLLGELSPLG